MARKARMPEPPKARDPVAKAMRGDPRFRRVVIQDKRLKPPRTPRGRWADAGFLFARRPDYLTLDHAGIAICLAERRRRCHRVRMTTRAHIQSGSWRVR